MEYDARETNTVTKQVADWQTINVKAYAAFLTSWHSDGKACVLQSPYNGVKWTRLRIGNTFSSRDNDGMTLPRESHTGNLAVESTDFRSVVISSRMPTTLGYLSRSP